MKILLLENDAPVIEIVRTALQDRNDIEIDVAQSRDAGISLVEANHSGYDLAIIDLQIPTADGALDEHVDYGMHVFLKLGEIAQGTPRVVWSGNATVDAMRDIADVQDRADPFGTGSDQRMVEIFDKRDLRECVAWVEGVVSEIDALEDVTWSWGLAPGDLDPMVKRVVNIFARRRGGAVVQAARLGDGFSDAQTLRLEIRNEAGALVALVVGKINTHEAVRDEITAYETFVASRLPPKAFTAYADRVVAGANGRVGVFYTLAEQYGESLFAVLERDVDIAVKGVASVRADTQNWQNGAPQVRRSVGDIRRLLVDDDTMAENAADIGFDWQQVEATEILVREAPAHGDLHGLNVLVDPNGVPVLIDFGEVKQAIGSLDPATLELSVMLHPSSPLRGMWPGGTPDAWADPDKFYGGCAHESFMRACREWAHQNAAEDREVAASAYAYCIRQLKYPDSDHGLALALASAAATAIRS